MVTHSGLEQMLAAWLPAQRWFAGGGAQVRDVAIASDVPLAAGDPELRHLIVAVGPGPERISYQVLVAIRADMPPEFADSVIGVLPDGRTAYDGAVDPELTAILLRGIAAERGASPLRFATEPGAVIDQDATARTLPALASNTSIVFGNKAILKLLRRPFDGCHPDLEIPAALARAGSTLVAAPLGWIEMSGRHPAVLAILSEYFANTTDGWSAATASLRAARPDFSGEARQLGAVTAKLHAELAGAFGTRTLAACELAETADAMAAELAAAVAVVPRLSEYEARILARYAALTKSATPVVVQRIHGDYHLAQVLRTDGGWVVLDFEGEPAAPLSQRRAFAPALRDVAGMLRSFDYAARHQLIQRPADQWPADQRPADQRPADRWPAGQRPVDQRSRSVAAQWVARCQDAFLAGYAEAGGDDPSPSDPLLVALTLAKAVYEAVYEARHRPDWLPIPLAAIAEASQ